MRLLNPCHLRITWKSVAGSLKETVACCSCAEAELGTMTLKQCSLVNLNFCLKKVASLSLLFSLPACSQQGLQNLVGFHYLSDIFRQSKNQASLHCSSLLSCPSCRCEKTVQMVSVLEHCSGKSMLYIQSGSL